MSTTITMFVTAEESKRGGRPLTFFWDGEPAQLTLDDPGRTKREGLSGCWYAAGSDDYGDRGMAETTELRELLRMRALLPMSGEKCKITITVEKA